VTPGRVLVVEDNDRNRKLVRTVLEHAGFDVIEAETGEEGVAIAAEAIPDLVLMDVQLPGIDGHDALRLLRGDHATSHVPVVAVTAFAMKGDDARALEEGFDGYIQKPISVRSLVDQVHALIRRPGPHEEEP
jgi:two-component system, cell cycle response regulator DivK